MSEKPKRTILIKRVVSGGALNWGDEMYADAVVADGSITRLVIPHATMEATVLAFLEFTGGVNKARLDSAKALGPGFPATDPHLDILPDRSAVALVLGLRLGLRDVKLPGVRLLPQTARSLAAELLAQADQIDPPKRAD